MLWILGGAFVLALWMAAPTLRTIPKRFEPSRRNDAIVFLAQHSSSHP